MTHLNIKPKFSYHLILQPTEENPNSPKMAYLTRQLFENKLRKQVDRWHGKPYSSVLGQKIQCQLEIHQDNFEWNDSVDIT